ncbi:MAG: PorT family protein [Bacteroidota bacterium]|nr:PorT family protein [Bacteroidota bacterium]
MPGFSQSAEIGFFLGTATYKGEISNSLFNPDFVKPAVGILYRRNFNNHWSYRLGLSYGSMIADDARSKDDYQNRRNLSFRSRTWDGHLLLEFNFLPYQIGNPESRFSPFVFGGIAVYYFNPQAELAGEWYNLQPLGTEGQGATAYPDRDPYNRIQVAIPFGGGVKIKISKRLGLTVEAGARRLFTDYFDDVSTTYADPDVIITTNGEIAALLADRSLDAQALNNTDRQRGNASDNDWYMFTGITLNYALSKKYYDNCTPFKRKLR